MIEIYGHFWSGIIGEDAGHRTRGRSFDGGIDLLYGHWTRGLKCQIHTGNIWRGHANGRTVQFSGHFRQDFAQSLSCTGRCRDQSHSGCTGAVKIAMAAIQGRLVACVAMNGGHDPTFNANSVIEGFDQRCQAIGGARAIRNYCVAAP